MPRSPSASCRAAAAEDDVPLVAERPLGLRRARGRTRAIRQLARLRVADRRVKIGSYSNSGSPGKYICVTSRSRERAAEHREVDVRRPPGVLVVPPRVGAGLDRDEAVAALVVGEAAAGAGEVRVERRRVLVDLVPVAAGGVRLPDLDERVPGSAGRRRRATRPVTMIRSPSGSPACCRVRSWSSSPTAPVAEHGAGRARGTPRGARRAAGPARASASSGSRGSRPGPPARSSGRRAGRRVSSSLVASAASLRSQCAQRGRARRRSAARVSPHVVGDPELPAGRRADVLDARRRGARRRASARRRGARGRRGR